MTNHTTKVGVWTFLITAFAGGIIIVAGNALTATANSPEVKAWGNSLRQAGLVVCVLTGVAFLISRNLDRMRQSAVQLFQDRAPATAGAAGPSPLLITLIRGYSVAIILFGIYAAGVYGWPMLAYGFYQSEWSGLYLLPTLLGTFIVVSPGFLIWGMTNALIRMDQKLGEVSQRTTELGFRLDRSTIPDAPKQQ